MAMNDYDVYIVERDAGRAPPIPWYYAFFQAAEKCNCSPWEFIPEETDRFFWMEAALIINSAEADHAAFLKKQQNAKNATIQAVRPGAIG